MKNIIIFSILLFVADTKNCTYGNGSHANNSRYLVQYKVDSCLENFIHSIVSSNKGFYSSSKFYYSLEFNIENKRGSLYIAPERWTNARILDYSSVICIGDMIFLCRSNYTEDPIFHKTTKKKKIALNLSDNQIGRFQNFREPLFGENLKSLLWSAN